MDGRAVIALALLAAAAPASAEKLGSVEILVLADYFDIQLPKRPRTGWWALCPGDPARLRPATVSMQPVPHPLGATFRMSAGPCGDAPILVRARRGLSERELQTAEWIPTGERLEKTVEVTLGKQRWSLRVVGEMGHEQWLEIAGERRQRIRVAEKGQDWMVGDWHLLWAGDLDGDGALDLVISMDGNVLATELYLSSHARGDQLVGHAASTAYGGC